MSALTSLAMEQLGLPSSADALLPLTQLSRLQELNLCTCDMPLQLPMSISALQ